MSDYYIPYELLTKIITYLPAKSLVRFRCVCKSWYSLITSPDFITTHLNQTTLTKNNHLLLLRYCPYILDSKQISLHIDNGTFNLCAREKVDFPFRSSETDFHVCGACNGLILSRDKTERATLMLWNPSIRKSLILPRPRYMYTTYDQIVGFGFDSRTNDYKVVRLVHQKVKGKLSPKVELYKLSTKSWETITATIDPSCFFYENILSETFLNGAVHWGAFNNDSSIIMSFNMSDEEISEIMPPLNVHFKLGFNIAVCGDWFSLFHFPNHRHCSVWAMKEYGIVESWTKLYTIDLWQGKGWMTPLGFRKNGQVLLRKLCGELFSYDSETQQIRDLGNSYGCGPSCLSLSCKFKAYRDAYVESLVLLGDENRLGAGDAKKKRKNRCAD